MSVVMARRGHTVVILCARMRRDATRYDVRYYLRRTSSAVRAERE